MRRLFSLLILLTLSLWSFAQTRKISGTVIDEMGIPIPNATIKVKNTTIGTSTEENGTFSIKAPLSANAIIVSAIGYADNVVSIDEKTSLTIEMVKSSAALDEVLVVAYGKATRKSLVGAVSSISAKDIEKRALTSVTGVLEGSAPGVMVSNTYGQPGSTPNIRIRGFTSVNGSNTPLYVVDGVIFEGNVADINPTDVESVSVLKDAASASLYGNRAANGVVLITTKRATLGKPTFGATMTQGMYNRGLKEYSRMTPNQWMETMWLGYRNNLLTTNPTLYNTVEKANAKATLSLVNDNIKYNIYDKPINALFDNNGKLLSDAKIKDGYLNDLDWYKPIMQTGHRQDYNANGAARSEKSGLYFSTGYLDEKGYFKKSRYQRFTGRLNGDITPVRWFRTGFVMNGSHQILNNYSDGNTSFVNPIYNARVIAPVYPVHLHDTATGAYILDAIGNMIYDDGSKYARPQYTARNAIWENELNMDRTFRNTMQGQVFADITFLKDFVFTTKADVNFRNTENQTYNNAIIGDGAGNKGRAARTLYRYKIYTFQQQLNWKKEIENHTVDVMAGHENYNYYYSYLYGYKTTETFAGQTDLINFTNITSLTDYQNNYRTESYLSRLRYNYNEKYFLEASIRRDGSSRFYKENRWGNFWSLGGSWIMSQEDFIKKIPTINYLKLRGGFGQVGNDQSAGTYAFMALYTMGQNSNTAALYKSQNEALGIRWETTENWGAALEGTLFKKVNFIAEYFDKRSVDLLFDVNLPLSAGATSSDAAEAVVTKNIGKISNRGWEFSLDADLIKTSDFKLNLGANVTLLKNKILNLPTENKKNGIISGTKKYMEGHGRYDYWLYQYVGVDQMTGNALYLPDTVVYNGGDASQTTKTAIPTQWLVKIGDKYYVSNPTYSLKNWSGSAIPKAFGSVTLKIDWRNLSFSGLFSYSFGAKILDYNYQSLMSMSGSINNLHTDLLKAWNGVPDGMTETSSNRINTSGVPVVDFNRDQYNNATSSRFLQDGSYAVIKNIVLGYKLPAKIVNKVGVANCSLNFTIENLATFTKLQGMDPQQSFDGLNYNYFMTPRVFSFGLNVGL